jgi:hypothetical protein
MQNILQRTFVNCLLLLGLLTVVFAPSLQAASTNTPPGDVEFTHKLVGKWKVALTDPRGLSINGTDEKKADGIFTSTVTFAFPDPKLNRTISVEGKWEIKNGVLIETITKSSDPQFPPVGMVSRDKIIKLDDKEFLYETERGKQESQTRIQ